MFSSTAAVLLDWEEPWGQRLPGRALARRARMASGLRCARPGAAVRWGRGVGALGGAAKAESAGERRRTWPAMDELVGKEKERLGTGLNDDGFTKRSIPWRIGR